MLAVRSAVPATYAVREFVEIGGKFCGADRSPLQADSSIGSSTEVSGKKCRWLLACQHFSLSSNSVSRGRFGAQFPRGGGALSTGGGGAPWGGPRHPGCPRGTYISITMGVPQKILFGSKSHRYLATGCRPGKSRSR
jgi:hypothetical protein